MAGIRGGSRVSGANATASRSGVAQRPDLDRGRRRVCGLDRDRRQPDCGDEGSGAAHACGGSGRTVCDAGHQRRAHPFPERLDRALASGSHRRLHAGGDAEARGRLCEGQSAGGVDHGARLGILLLSQRAPAAQGGSGRGSARPARVLEGLRWPHQLGELHGSALVRGIQGHALQRVR